VLYEQAHTVEELYGTVPLGYILLLI